MNNNTEISAVDIVNNNSGYIEGAKEKLNIFEFLEKYKIQLTKSETLNGTTYLTLESCPFHSGERGAAKIFYHGKSPAGFCCTCRECANRDIKDVVRYYDPEFFLTEKLKKKNISIVDYKEEFERFESRISSPDSFRPRSTGFPFLDKSLAGGFLPGVTIVCAGPSAGKTAFCLQTAEQCALTGTRVLYFSLEMPIESTFARGLSRFVHSLYMEQDKDERKFPEAPEMTDKIHGGEYDILKAAHNNWSEEDYSAFLFAKKEMVDNLNGNMYVVAGRKTMSEIDEYVEFFDATVGTPGLVVVDYLQFITPESKTAGADTKTQTDEKMNRINQMSAKYNIPVVCISSVARSSYEGELGMSSAKESGSIEYNASRLWGLTAVKDEKCSPLTLADAPNLEYVKLSLIKNRGMPTGVEIYYSYNKKYNLFTEMMMVNEHGESTMSSNPDAKNLFERVNEVNSFSNGAKSKTKPSISPDKVLKEPSFPDENINELFDSF